ncbi:MAG: Fur family transcriptional regulator [Microbacteriaceae bacterium]
MSPSVMMPSPEVAIRQAGLRLTAPRGFVFDALASRPHASADEVLATVKCQHADASIQSVYNALGDFERVGLVRRIELAGHPGRYELRVGDNHHHLVCSECGRVEDIDCVTGEAPCLAPGDDHGYTIHVAEVTFWGVCSACAS